MTAFVFPNYLNTTLAAATSSTSTSFTLASAANLPTLAPGQVMPMTLNDAATGLVYEIVYVTAISGTTLTALRAQEGTSAQNWSAGDMAFTGPTGGTDAPIIGTHSPVASETLFNANQLIVMPGALTADITLTLPNAPATGAHYRIYGSSAGFSVTVDTSVTTGSPNIQLPDQSTIYSWVIPASGDMQGIDLVFDGTNWRGQTFGATVVAPATASNQAVNLGQLFIGNRKSVFTANGTFTVPSAVTTIWVSGCGAGGGGGGGNMLGTSTQGGGGGGGYAGQQILKNSYAVTPGDSLSVSIGGGGSGGAGAGVLAAASAGATGGNTVLTNTTTTTTLVTLAGGAAGGGAIATSTSVFGGAGFNSGWCEQGSTATQNSFSGFVGYGGSGQSSIFGSGGAAGSDSGNVGGGGAGAGGGGAGSGNVGGNGGNGFLIIEW